MFRFRLYVVGAAFYDPYPTPIAPVVEVNMNDPAGATCARATLAGVTIEIKTRVLVNEYSIGVNAL